MMIRWSCLLVVVVGGCVTKNPNVCTADSDCTNPDKPFCDINGEYDESGHMAAKCSPVPANCPVARCGCTPGAPLSCDANQLTTCAEDGLSVVVSTCPLGCVAGPACAEAAFTPSHGLGAVVAAAEAGVDVSLPDGTAIDTGSGEVKANAQTLSVTSMLVDQAGGLPIRAFVATSFDIGSVTVTGPNPIAFVSTGSIKIHGHLDVSATHELHGAGSVPNVSACEGADVMKEPAGCTIACYTNGAGGGGNYTSGGSGGRIHQFDTPPAAGASIVDHSVLVGGCRGGDYYNPDGSLANHGGGGGGAIQIVSFSDVALSNGGYIDVTGGGGVTATGGGAGGTIVIEARTVSFDGTAAGLAGNGGAGGACNGTITDGDFTAFAAPAQKCTYNNGNHGGGDGGTALVAAGDGDYFCPNGQTCNSTGNYQGGGGGSVGYARISTRDGSIVTTNSPGLFIALELATLSQ